jgi:hypothetical protein
MIFWGPRMDQEPDLYDEPPQEWRECPACDGKGYTVHRVTVYEHGCGFPHYDSDERECEKCQGCGGWVDDVEADRHESGMLAASTRGE